jgi:dCTP deaminase
VLLSDRDIRAEIASGRLGIDPFDDTLVQPSSVDVRLDNLFRVFNNTRYTHIDPARQQDELTSLVQAAEGEPFVLHPGEFVLGSTLECCTLPDDLAGRLEGKSSLGRLGLLTHSTAGFIDPGFSGHITLELSNVANLPITLWPGMKIGQLCLLRLTSPAEHPYGSASVGSKYQGQRGPTPSRLTAPDVTDPPSGPMNRVVAGSRTAVQQTTWRVQWTSYWACRWHPRRSAWCW